jgi:hypothetical protein
LLSLFLPVRIKHNPDAAKRAPTIRDANHRGRTMARAAIAEQVRMRRDSRSRNRPMAIWMTPRLADRIFLLNSAMASFNSSSMKTVKSRSNSKSKNTIDVLFIVSPICLPLFFISCPDGDIKEDRLRFSSGSVPHAYQKVACHLCSIL